MSTKLGGVTDNGHVKIHIYSNDHNRPHAHIQFGGQVVRCELEEPFRLLDDPRIIPKKKLDLAIEYIKENRARLLRNFERANPHLRKKKSKKKK